MNTIHNSSSVNPANFYRIDINLYPLFLAIYEQQSISQAAKLLCISQSAASHALQRLRLLLDDDVFVRHGQKMRPTALSLQIYPTIQQALSQLQNISMPQQNFNLKQLGHLNIAMHDEIEPLLLARLFRHFKSFNPKIIIQSIKLDRKSVIAEMDAQQIDFFVDLEQNFGPRVCSVQLLQDQFVVCSQHRHMDLETYLKAPHIGVSSRRTGTLVEDIYLEQKQLKRNIMLRCQHYSTALDILQYEDQAILTLPLSVIKQMQLNPQLKLHSIPLEFPVMSLDLYWANRFNSNLRLKVIREEIMSIFA